MLKFLSAFVIASILFFSQNVFAVIQAEVPRAIKQGDVIKVVIMAHENAPHEVHFYPAGWPTDKNGKKKEGIKVDAVALSGGKQIALIPIGVSEEPGIGLISIFSRYEGYSFAIEIQKVDFPESKKVFLVMEPTSEILKQSREERAFLDKLYAQITPKKYFSKNLQFTNPLEENKMKIVQNADFGQIRKKALINPKTRRIKGRWKDYHKGVDLVAWLGKSVFAAEDGKVVAARKLLGSGNTVIINHGYGLLSLYFHLSKIYVKEGADVFREEGIGLAGMSGNAEGPHLHFEVRLYGVPVNPFEFLQGARE